MSGLADAIWARLGFSGNSLKVNLRKSDGSEVTQLGGGAHELADTTSKTTRLDYTPSSNISSRY